VKEEEIEDDQEMVNNSQCNIDNSTRALLSYYKQVSINQSKETLETNIIAAVELLAILQTFGGASTML